MVFLFIVLEGFKVVIGEKGGRERGWSWEGRGKRRWRMRERGKGRGEGREGFELLGLINKGIK